MDAHDLNRTLKELMDGLSVKVFRTYNASITLDRLLMEPSDSEVLDAKKADYDRANKEVHAAQPCVLVAHIEVCCVTVEPAWCSVTRISCQLGLSRV